MSILSAFSLAFLRDACKVGSTSSTNRLIQSQSVKIPPFHWRMGSRIRCFLDEQVFVLKVIGAG
ncbi:hypothetical protein [Aeribacillus composti]|uniref:hypothetical protein n=1 Tax=Aeribacillus composti TaxID=1868734 RepID=UPI003D1DD9C5